VHLWQYNGRKEWWTRDISNCPPKDHVFWTLIQAVGQLPMADRVKQKKTSATVLFESLFEEGVI
ncbi:MAG: hypothetical protein Q7U56_10420, partial [Humidesulfovibrio sp.]|nr:hypothetical protein [Humidesulfovibrio sp.]